MIKKLVVFFSIALFLNASDPSYAIKKNILAAIFKNLSSDKEFVIWSDDKKLLKEFEKDIEFKTSPNCKDSSLVIIKDPENLTRECTDKPVFTLDYSLLKELPYSFGAFFWKKGRPNIVIIKPRVNALSISASQTLDKYIEEKIW